MPAGEGSEHAARIASKRDIKRATVMINYDSLIVGDQMYVHAGFNKKTWARDRMVRLAKKVPASGSTPSRDGIPSIPVRADPQRLQRPPPSTARASRSSRSNRPTGRSADPTGTPDRAVRLLLAHAQGQSDHRAAVSGSPQVHLFAFTN